MDAETRDYREVLQRDPCSYCGAIGQMDIDHIVPVKDGGADDWSNLTASCKVCNSSKSRDDLLSFLSRSAWVAPLDPAVSGESKGRQWTAYVPQTLSQTYRALRDEAKGLGIRPAGPSELLQAGMRIEVARLQAALTVAADELERAKGEKR